MPNRDDEINSTKTRSESAYDFFSLVHCFIEYLSCPSPTQYISYSYGTVWPVCAESAVQHRLTNQPTVTDMISTGSDDRTSVTSAFIKTKRALVLVGWLNV